MKRMTILASLAAALASVPACDKKTDAPAAEASKAAPEAASAQATLTAYESIRKLLVRDQTVGLSEAAAELERTARAAKLDAIATAAAALKAKSGDIEEARQAFGEVSREVVALLVREPKLQEGRRVFECPMAKGYNKWVQPGDEIENPYMGARMLACGGKSDWST